MAAKYKLVIVRHGESEFTLKSLFCGFGNDADLSETGAKEAIHSAQLIKKEGIEFDVAYTSVLKRAIKTLYLIQEELDCHWLPVHKSWRLNERHHGALQGLSKSAMAEKYGEEKVKLWRRSYHCRPEPLDKANDRYCFNAKPYAHMDQSMIPDCESLKDTVERLLPYWYDEIAPAIKCGKRVLIVAHGNSCRSLVKFLENISDDDIINVEVPQGIPLVYELGEDLRPVKHYYLGSEEELAAGKAKQINQGKPNFQGY